MLGLTIDLAGAVIKLIEVYKWNKWIRAYTGIIGSFCLSCAFTSGVALTAHRPPWEALGEGLIIGSAMATKAWRSSELMGGTVLALPAKEAEVELKTNSQVIYKK